MITSLAYAIILMGCSDDMSMCKELAKDNRAFTTKQQCEQWQDEALMSDVALEIDYPVVASKCIEREHRFAQAGARYIAR